MEWTDYRPRQRRSTSAPCRKRRRGGYRREPRLWALAHDGQSDSADNEHEHNQRVMSLTAGARLGPYEIISPLGAGGMGEVYRATDTRLGRPVAIKVLRDGAVASAQTLERFQREARAASALNHPNICTIYDVGTDPPFIAMELLEGETLQRRLQRGSMEFPVLVDIGAAVADALDAAHG